MKLIHSEFKGRANFIGIYDLRSPRVLILQPKLLKEIFIQKFKNFHNNDFLHVFNPKLNPFFERNTFLSSDEKWKELRTEASPAFTSNRMKVLFPIVTDVCNQLTSYIKENIRQPIEMKDLGMKFVHEAASNCVFGIQVNGFQKEETEMARMAKNIFNIDSLSLTTLTLNALFPITRTFLKIEFAPPNVIQFFLNLVQTAKDYRSKNNIVQEDFLDYLIVNQKKKGSPDMHLASSCVTFFTDGLESTSSLVACTLYEVSKPQWKVLRFQNNLIVLVGPKPCCAKQAQTRN